MRPYDYDYVPPWRQALSLFVLVVGVLIAVGLMALMARWLWNYLFTNLPADYNDPEALATR